MNLDLVQLEVEKKLQELAADLNGREQKKFWHRLFPENRSIESLYIYGDVGCGKTMLMRNFFHSVTGVKKSYFHFNVFMNSIHEALRDIRIEKNTIKDELILAVKRVVGTSKLICFDEFQVVDIADAMLLARIFSEVFSKKITVVFTSNSEPNQLYKNGLQRELFLEFVNKVLVKNCQILHLNSQIDYRGQFSHGLTQRYFSSYQENCGVIKGIIKKFTEKDPLQPSCLKVWGRDVLIKRSNKQIALFTFDELCKNNLSASDYRVICGSFNLIFLLKPYSMTAEDINEARRLTVFIDEIYENKTALIILANCEIEEIYSSLNNATWSRRTVSRLNEIKSDHYWSNSKIFKTNL
jgi:predicted ATPase